MADRVLSGKRKNLTTSEEVRASCRKMADLLRGKTVKEAEITIVEGNPSRAIVTFIFREGGSFIMAASAFPGHSIEITEDSFTLRVESDAKS